MVNKKLLMPQEVETFYVLPTIRRYIAQELKKQGHTQTKIASLMHINKAAISQYLHAKRGHQISFNKEIITKITAQTKQITDEISYIKGVQQILNFIRDQGYICKIHKQFSLLPKECSPKETGCFGGCQ